MIGIMLFFNIILVISNMFIVGYIHKLVDELNDKLIDLSMIEVQLNKLTDSAFL